MSMTISTGILVEIKVRNSDANDHLGNKVVSCEIILSTTEDNQSDVDWVTLFKKPE